MSNVLEVSVPGGKLRAFPAQDPDYPGIWVEYVPANPLENTLSNPSVLVEWPQPHAKDSKLRALIWGDLQQEDFSEEFAWQLPNA